MMGRISGASHATSKSVELRSPLEVNVESEASKRRISIIMPAYNVEDDIAEAISEVKRVVEKITDDYEIMVVNDGSTDETARIIEEIRNEHVKIVNHAVNMGKGMAIKTGVKYASGDYTILLDADRDIDVKNMAQYIEALREYDVVIGSKRHPKSIYQAPTLRKVLSVGYNILVKALLRIRVGDTQTGFKAFKTNILKMIMNVIVVKRYSWDAEALAVANMLKLKIAEAPVHIRQEKLFKFKDVLNMLIELLGIMYRLRVIKWYQKNIEKLNLQYKPPTKI
jgi:glycosyltransferase involved in cell wall biosynthesis